MASLIVAAVTLMGDSPTASLRSNSKARWIATFLFCVFSDCRNCFRLIDTSRAMTCHASRSVLIRQLFRIGHGVGSSSSFDQLVVKVFLK